MKQIIFALLLPLFTVSSCGSTNAECKKAKQQALQFATAFCLAMASTYNQSSYYTPSSYFASCWLEFGGLSGMGSCSTTSSSKD